MISWLVRFVRKSRKPVVTVFLTSGMSLKKWEQLGSLQRELAVYQILKQDFSIQFVSYGNIADLEYERTFPEFNILLPSYYKNSRRWLDRLKLARDLLAIRSSSLLKTNQISGAENAIYCGKRFNIPVIARCGYLLASFTRKKNASADEIRRAEQLEAHVFNKAQVCVTSSERDRQEVIHSYGIAADKIRVIPNYVDTQLFSPAAIRPEPGSLLFIGRLEPQKNLFALLDAFEKSTRAVSLTIAGSGSQEKELKERAAQIAGKTVTFLGNVQNSDLPALINRHQIFILPSLFEGLPKTLLEAMSCGVPCIGTNVEGIKEVLKHQENGWLCETRAEALVRAIDDLLGAPEIQAKIAAAARNEIEAHYSLEKVAAQEKKLYEEMIFKR